LNSGVAHFEDGVDGALGKDFVVRDKSAVYVGDDEFDGLVVAYV
jgi:hypothetical protein